MNPNDLNDFKKAMNTITAAIDANEKFLVNALATRLTRAAEENPGDQTIYSLAAFLRSKAEKDMFISKADLNKVYDTLYTYGTNASNYLEKELIKKDLKVATKTARENEEFDIYKSADSHLVNMLTSVFDKTASVKNFSNEIAKLAEKVCTKELSYYPVLPIKVEVIAGNSDALLCKASYETPKGQSHVLIPVEVNEGKTLIPSVFVSTAGFEDLNRDNLGKHLTKSAGKNFQVDVDAVLNVIKTAKHGISEDLNEVERIVVKTELNRKAENNDFNSMFFEITEKTAGDVKLIADVEDVQSFSQKLSSTKGIAEITFGKKAVNAGKVMIRQAMESFGYKNVQVAISDVNTDTVYYSASTGLTGIKIPVKFANELPIPPSIALANGVIESFDNVGIDKLLNEGDVKEAALTSVFYGSKPNELIENIKTAMENQDLVKAEEILNVLANFGDNKAYNFGFSLYMNGLKPVEKTASVIHKCAMQVKSPNSIHILCGHTNLPLNKVYQDKNGECLPLYHRNSEEATGGSFLDSRIYIG